MMYSGSDRAIPLPASRRRFALLSSVPVVTLGLLVVTFAMLRVPWPPDQPSATRYGITVTYFERLQGVQVGIPDGAPDALTGKGTTWTVRRMLDGLALVALVVGYLSVVLLFWLDTPFLLVNLVIIGVYGAVYGGSVGLHPGPVLASAGFGLILCSAGLTLTSQWASANRRTHNNTGSDL